MSARAADADSVAIGLRRPPVLEVEAEFPEKLGFLLARRQKLPDGSFSLEGRYKVAWGGRGGAKSWAFARAILLLGLSGDLRVLCTREVQSSMKESVHQLLKDQIIALGLSNYYRVLDTEIRGPGKTLITFKGLTDPDALKSTEGVDICWVEEARSVTKSSWAKLIPTIRKPGSEIWVSFNPELETDDTYIRFVVNKPPGAVVVHLSYRDNPWFPQDLRLEMEHLKATDYDEYLHVYEGNCRVALEGAVYANEIRETIASGRILTVPVERSKPVITFWDLGRGDMTAIWFVQIVGFEYRVVGYYQSSGHVLDHYIAKLEEIRLARKWFYGTAWLPHDGKHQLLASRRTIEQQLQDAGFRTRIVPNISIAEGINAARTIFPRCYFDRDETAEGLNCLRHYHYGVKEKTGARTREPVHDWSSHGADAWRMMGVALKEDTVKPKPKPPVAGVDGQGPQSWMGR